MRKIFITSVCLFLIVLGAWAQNKTISGKVTDDKTGNPLAGVSVTVKGTPGGTQTDPDGSFTLSVPSSSRILVFSFVGYGSKEVDLGNSNIINTSLSVDDGKSLDEVVVVAYGEQQRKKVTGSVAKLSGRQFENVPLPSVESILQGKVAGLQSLAPTGQPGAAQQIRIRGIGSINASSEPLFVVDGIPINTGDPSNLTNSSNLLASFNPNDIESVSVLKDASAASIYGSRAANGVIIINTKKGKAGKTKVRVDGEFGSNTRAYFPSAGKPLNKAELNELFSEGLTNYGFPQADVDGIMDQLGFNSDRNYDWLDLVSRHGQQQQVNVSASGGDAKTQFFLSGGFFKQQSPVLGADLKRYSASLNLKHQLSKSIAVGTTLNLSSFKQTGEFESSGFRNPIIAAMGLLPTQEAFNPDGTPNIDKSVFDQIYNPLATMIYDKQNNQTSKFLGSVFGEYKILDNLKLTSRFGIDYNNVEEYLYYNPLFGDAQATQGHTYNNYNRIYNYIWTNLADYNFRTLGERLDGSITVGYEAQKSQAYTQAADGEVVPKNRNLAYPVPAVPKTATVDGSDYSFTSLLSRAQINFLNRYSLSGSIRRDGSSRFGSNNRFGTFWSVGAAWNIDEESFMLDSKVISALKLRASYGVNGNAGIGNYDWRSIYLFTTTYNGSPGSVQANVGNPNLTWEQNKPFNVGLEVGFLDNRITLETDYYIRKTENLLLEEPLSNTSGFQTFDNNVGAMENRGLEVTINATPVRTKNFSWTISANASWNRNKVTRLREGTNEIIGNPFTLQVGKDVQSYLLRQWAGADPTNGDPQWYIDGTKQSKTNDFSEADRVLVGSASPKGFGGVSTSLVYKFITLDAQLNYQYGNYVYNQWDFIFLGDGAFLGLNQNRKQLQRWQNPGDVTDVPKYVLANGTSSNEVSTRYLYKGDFMRLRNVTLGFDIPAKWIEKIHLTKLNIYLRGTNLWTKTFDDNLTMEPEQPVNGVSDLQYFIPKSYTVGISIQL
jgi:TonB-linked SusC/RagA family outer membrane protein